MARRGIADLQCRFTCHMLRRAQPYGLHRSIPSSTPVLLTSRIRFPYAAARAYCVTSSVGRPADLIPPVGGANQSQRVAAIPRPVGARREHALAARHSDSVCRICILIDEEDHLSLSFTLKIGHVDGAGEIAEPDDGDNSGTDLSQRDLYGSAHAGDHDLVREIRPT